ncbi:proteolipid protein 2 isoform X3 [Saccopteryx bilineata]|uniref:proteolipid protein 2 isoform X3 n=1 Tax=Saccopteryx bilineata TaxID=59482 RepID=UPI00338F7991
MADSERFSAPGCWAAFTNFARTCKGILLLAEIDFLRTLIATILYLIISIIVLVEKGNHSKIVAGVMGLIAACLFGYDAYFTFPLRQQRHTAAPTDTADGPV